MVMPKWRQQLKQTRWRPALPGCQLIFVCKANPGIIQITTVDGQNKALKKCCVTYFWVKYSWKVITAWRPVREDAVFSSKSTLCWWKLPTSTFCKALGECECSVWGWWFWVWLIQKKQLEGKYARNMMQCRISWNIPWISLYIQIYLVLKVWHSKYLKKENNRFRVFQQTCSVSAFLWEEKAKLHILNQAH